MSIPIGRRQAPDIGPLEEVARFDGPMPTGVTVSRRGRIFVNFPRWGDRVEYTVGELQDGYAVAYPDPLINRPRSNNTPDALVSVQSVVVDPADRLWILDTGSPEFKPTAYGGPKLVCVDLEKDSVVQTILFPQNVALPTSYLNDVRFDLRRGASGMAFITDSSDQGPNGIVVVDLNTGTSWRRLHDHPSTKAQPNFRPVVEGEQLLVRPVNGSPRPLAMGADGIAISADGARLYYCPLASRRLYSVDVDTLVNPDISEELVAATVVDEGEKGASDGLESDAAGSLYISDYEHGSIRCRLLDGRYVTVAQDPRIVWPDTLALARDSYLYFTGNQFNRQARFHEGTDQRQPPYYLFRVRIGAQPVLLQ